MTSSYLYKYNLILLMQLYNLEIPEGEVWATEKGTPKTQPKTGGDEVLRFSDGNYAPPVTVVSLCGDLLPNVIALLLPSLCRGTLLD